MAGGYRRTTYHQWRKPWVYHQPSQVNRRIWVIEVLQIDGVWKPIFAPSGPDFSLKTARELIQKHKKESLAFRRAHLDGRTRLMMYEQTPLFTAGRHEEE